MKRNLIIFVCVCIAIGVAGFLIFALHNREPRYNGKRLSEWLLDLDDQKSGPANDQAIEAIHHVGARGLPVILNMLQAHDRNHQHRAILACYELGPEAKPAIPILIKLLNKGETRGYLGAAFGRIGPDTIPPLIQSLTNNNEAVRTEIVSSLGNMQNYSKEKETESQKSGIVSALINCLEDRSQYVRAFAVRSLGQINVEETVVVPALVKSLKDSDLQVRWSACLALGEFGTRADAAVPALLTALNDSRDVRDTAAIALVEIEPDNLTQIEMLLPILTGNIEGARGGNKNFSYPSVTALGLCGKRAAPAVSILLKAAQDASGYERKHIAEALKKIDPEAAAKVSLN